MPLLIVFAVATRWLLKYVITKALLFLGFGYVSYLGIDVLFDEAEQAVYAHLGDLPEAALNYALLAGLDEYLQIVFSAISAGLVIRGITAGASTVLRWASR